MNDKKILKIITVLGISGWAFLLLQLDKAWHLNFLSARALEIGGRNAKPQSTPSSSDENKDTLNRCFPLIGIAPVFIRIDF
ncbi:hypothetical protein J7E79_00365 [Bacillus sp. ISL-40]|uniref:hypothetical protein n=1 Tax=unclassified Bacillus (in: firmicutes) TaxID=185979 RepID=UPI001BE8E1E0|nr:MULTISPECIES: hypothetical protein [unclassified Bacillus (in: firmicutes)]MBT2695901.1 hypothetical protein [Bacillus sp. ISL-40]MBT2739743.1 hypothetical protein [Bacillus sp. ISL-77]